MIYQLTLDSTPNSSNNGYEVGYLEGIFVFNHLSVLVDEFGCKFDDVEYAERDLFV